MYGTGVIYQDIRHCEGVNVKMPMTFRKVTVIPGYNPESINVDFSRKGILLALIDPESSSG